jgi:hypothetical protein
MSTSVTFLLRIFYETISVNACFDMPKVLENAMTPRGVLTPISIFMPRIPILRRVAGGQVRKERDN